MRVPLRGEFGQKKEEEAREEKKIEAESKKRGKLLHKLCGGKAPDTSGGHARPKPVAAEPQQPFRLSTPLKIDLEANLGGRALKSPAALSDPQLWLAALEAGWKEAQKESWAENIRLKAVARAQKKSGRRRTLGLLVSPDDNPQYLVVDDVRGPSLISEWNAEQPEELRIHQGDQILAVNGVAGWWEEMLRTIQVQASKPGDVLKLVVI
ncbi:hypothetical protein AK812_SmicGene19774 [Symbiodinium microadriaticum]|uniref:PDZ domain-containing protein n=1 Tax=Symbiodinium microadriaticum TaxID=2951 RepID=A0A1Q9DRL8_SYMMI|nr:hypothetical protein AK812_SmicGene19774 [Symbiodinium microadriaticum]